MQEYKVVVDNDGTALWYNLEDLLHRENEPAIEYSNGDKSWYKNGKRHREDGPALVFANGYKAWYLDGLRYTEEEWNQKLGKHTITLDGKTVEVSAESYENLRKLFD